MRPASALLAAMVALVAGCGGNDESDSDEAQISAVLEKLFAAQDQGDAEPACNDVYVIREPWESAEAEEESGEDEAENDEAEEEGEGAEGEAGVEECELAFERTSELQQRQTRNVSTEIGTIEVDGDDATALVHTELERADGSALSQDAPYELVRTPDGWRVRISEEG